MYNPLFVSEHSVEIVNINFLDLDSNTVIHWICMQGRSQIESDSQPRVGKKATFPQFSLILLDFLYLSSIFLHFLPQFEAPGGWTRVRRPWLRHCLYAYMLYLWSCGRATWCSSQWQCGARFLSFQNLTTNLRSSLPGRVSVWPHHYHTVNQSTMYRITYLHKKIPAVYSQSVEFIRSAQWTYLPSPVITLCVQKRTRK